MSEEKDLIGTSEVVAPVVAPQEKVSQGMVLSESETSQVDQPEVVQPAGEEDDEIVVVPSYRRKHEKPEDGRGRFFVLRQILNLVFMLVGVAGVVITFTVSNLHGAIIFIIAMSFKMAECVLRYLK